MITVIRVRNQDRSTCDSCENAPEFMTMIGGHKALENENVFLCKPCLKSLYKKLREFIYDTKAK